MSMQGMYGYANLPKGMHIPPAEPEPEQDREEQVASKPLTQAEVNYSKLIRQALEGIADVDIVVSHMTAVEETGDVPRVTLDLDIYRKGEG